MATRSLRDTEQFKLGRRGERIVAAMFQRAGFWIIPSYDYAGEDGDTPPRLQGAHGHFVIPDFDAAIEGQRRWIEVKTKQGATLHHLTGRYEHGFSLRLLEHYVEVQGITGTEVWVVVYEIETGDVVYQTLDALYAVARFYHGPKMGPSGMVFFPKDAFLLFGNIDDVDAETLALAGEARS